MRTREKKRDEHAIGVKEIGSGEKEEHKHLNLKGRILDYLSEGGSARTRRECKRQKKSKKDGHHLCSFFRNKTVDQA